MPEVVGITVHLTFARRAFELADWYRKRGSKVILGGLHVLSCPEECAPHADALAFGRWRNSAANLRDVEADRLQARYSARYESDYSEDPPPRRSILPRHSFLTTVSLSANGGCHNRCALAIWPPMVCDSVSRPDPKQVAADFAADRQPYAVFVDNNLGSRRDYLHSLCSALRPLNKIWSAAVSIDVSDDPSLIRNMALAGCTGVFIGFESLTDDNLSEAHKKTPKTSDYARRVKMLHDCGIQVNGSFVLGFDHDRKDVFARTAEWVEENRLECATFHILTPYPATPLFRQMESEKRLLHRDWTLYDTAHAVFQPRHMTPDELEQGYAWIYDRLFSHSSIWRRRPQDWSAVPLYLAMSYSVQTFESFLASTDQARPRARRLAAPGRNDASAAPSISSPPGGGHELPKCRPGYLRRGLRIGSTLLHIGPEYVARHRTAWLCNSTRDGSHRIMSLPCEVRA